MANAQAKVRSLRRITQRELQDYRERKDHIDGLKHQLKEAEKEIGGIDLEFVAKVEGGYIVENGPLVGAIDLKERRTVQWKSVVTRRCGADVVDLEIARCEPTKAKHFIVFVKTPPQTAA